MIPFTSKHITPINYGSPFDQKEELTDKDKERKAKKLKKTAKQLADPNIEMSDFRRKMKKYKKTKEQINQEQR